MPADGEPSAPESASHGGDEGTDAQMDDGI